MVVICVIGQKIGGFERNWDVKEKVMGSESENYWEREWDKGRVEIERLWDKKA